MGCIIIIFASVYLQKPFWNQRFNVENPRIPHYRKPLDQKSGVDRKVTLEVFSSSPFFFFFIFFFFSPLLPSFLFFALLNTITLLRKYYYYQRHIGDPSETNMPDRRLKPLIGYPETSMWFIGDLNMLHRRPIFNYRHFGLLCVSD